MVIIFDSPFMLPLTTYRLELGPPAMLPSSEEDFASVCLSRMIKEKMDSAHSAAGGERYSGEEHVLSIPPM